MHSGVYMHILNQLPAVLNVLTKWWKSMGATYFTVDVQFVKRSAAAPKKLMIVVVK